MVGNGHSASRDIDWQDKRSAADTRLHKRRGCLAQSTLTLYHLQQPQSHCRGTQVKVAPDWTVS